MKVRLAIVALLVMALPLPAAAQNASFEVGFKGGVNFSQVSGAPESEQVTYNQLTGFGGGIEMGFAVSPSMDILTDVLYLQKGNSAHSKYRLGSESGDQYREWDTDVTLSYVVFAPTFRFSTQGGGVAPYILAGAEIGILVDAKAQQTEGDAGGTDQEFDLKDSYKSTDLGLNFGAGFEIKSSSYALFFEGRYGLGLSNIASDEAVEASPSLELKHRGIYVFGGVRF